MTFYKIPVSSTEQTPKLLTKIVVVRLQHRFYVPLALLLGFVIPTALAWWWWDEALGGLLYAGHVGKLCTWHATFCINSFAHWLGSQDYSLQFTARGNLLLALLTNGEGKGLAETL